MHLPSISAAEAPTQVRWKVLKLAVAMAVITYVHRVCLAQAAPTIRAELTLSELQMGRVFSAFMLAYAIFQIPSGLLADKIGSRRVLSLGVAGWSLCVAASGWASNAILLMATRFGVGVGQAAAFPAITKSFVTWLPARERVVAQGVLWLSARWGGAFTPLLVVALMQGYSWRWTFQILAVLGIAWAFVFWLWYRDDPRSHGEPNEAELELIAPVRPTVVTSSSVPWARFARSGSVWLLCLQYFCLAFSWVFYITWLPTYLLEARGQSMASGAFLAGFPLFFGGLGCVSCGFALGKLEQWLDDTARARRWVAGTGSALAGGMLIVSLHLSDPLWAMVAMGLASFANDLAMPPSWGTCMDVGGPHAASLSACMNTAGNLGAVAAPLLVAYILAWTDKNWALTFYVFAGSYFVAAVCWMFINPASPEDSEPAAS
jgi:MFS transporter, ACS family, glucarate transporter